MPTKVRTLTEHIMLEQKDYPFATGAFSGLMTAIALVTKVISRDVNKAGISEILGLTGEKNVQGEEVQKLDEFAQEAMVKMLRNSGLICLMASEEEKDPISPREGFPCGKYVVNFDPLDGSSNIDVNVSIGTIFSVYHRASEGTGPGTIEDLLQKGSKQVAAGYVIYGSSTVFVYCAGKGVHGFTLDPSLGEFLLSYENITTPAKGKIYSTNEGNYNYWHDGMKRYIDYLKEPDKASERPYTSRYIGSLVADFHRNLLYGGIFLYPADTKDPKKPHGKLRLLYEANPIAFIAEHAGGYASTGTERIMDIEPTDIHQRVPLIVGSVEDVKIAEEFIQGKK